MRPDRSARGLIPRALERIRRGRLGILGLALTVAVALLWQGIDRPSEARDCAVVNVHDGDTLTVRCGVQADQSRRLKVRVWGIDAPEIEQQPWGTRARDRLRELARGDVNVRKVERDDYGRTVARLYRDGEDLGLALVREGYVAVYWRYNDDPRYARATREARSRRLGIWERSGLQQAPWEWRREHPAR